MSVKTLKLVVPDIVVCLNGTLPHQEDFECLRLLPIAAADGASLKLRDIGIIPQYIVGDLDSVAQERIYWEQCEHVFIEEQSSQDTTDFEKTLDFVRSRGYSSIIVIGLHGGEFDHTLNNWSILMRYGKTMRIAIYDNGTTALPVYESVQFSVQPGEMLSLIPQPEATLTTHGLMWNLSNETLALGKREGARNQARHHTVTIYLHSGSFLLFLKSSLPFMPQIV
ncbi:MAG: thiamine diphosphokinase [Bacteroidota bacterium]|nr:thiamine diphosphokinase [Candidatus Kapabacteria bacterium]MDW8218962.1 thiamine diphosphokinase [Bacteroidota bacterium]